jgi:hypothetical protein
LRDAPYAGLFVVVYEAIKYEAASVVRPSTPLVSAALHGSSAAAAGTIATLATHPFDVIKVLSPSFHLLSRARTLTPFHRQGCRFAVKTNTAALRGQSWQCGLSVPSLAAVSVLI